MAKNQAATTRSTAPQDDLGQITAELKAAKDLAAIKEARQNAFSLPQPVSERPEIVANQRAAWQSIQYEAAKKGLETGKFDEILARNQADLARIAEEQRAAGIKQSAGVLAKFAQAIDGKRQAFEALITAADDPQPVRVVLEKPFLIWPTQGLEFMDANVAPFRSSAKVTLDSGKTQGHEELGFYFIWRNPSDRIAVVNIDAFLLFSGQLRASQGGGFWPGSRFAKITVGGRLHVFEWWNHPPTEPFFQVDQAQTVKTVETHGGGFGDVGAIELESVFRTIALGYTHFLLPPNAVTVIEVTPTFDYSTGSDSGHVNADFNSGDFQLMCPFVSIGILT
ncbi:MAG: hypothetical protein U1G07_26410 [Verrucomicrobiota bacterium]